MFQLTLWSLPSLVSMLVSLQLCWRLARRDKAPGTLQMYWIVLFVAIWSFGQLIGSLSTSLDVKVFFTQIQYTAIALLPVCWLAFALAYATRRRVLGWQWRVGLGFVPAITIFLVWTNDLQPWLWQDIRLMQADGYVGMRVEHGFWFIVHSIFSYFAIGLATLMLLVQLGSSPRHRLAMGAVVAAPAFVAFVNFLFLRGSLPYPFIDPTPLAFAVAVIILSRGVLDSDMLLISPALHREIIDQLPDGVIIRDGSGVIVELNASAAHMLDPPLVAGETLRRLEAAKDDDSDTIAENTECTIGTHSYHVRVHQLNADEEARPHSVFVFRDISERLSAERALLAAQSELELQAYSDTLTGLCNRRRLMERLGEEFERSKRTGQPLSLLLLDLDRFKLVNDRYGHAGGDAALVAVAQTLALGSRVVDTVGRIGGEEFCVVLPETGEQDALLLAERLRVQVSESRIKVSDQEVVNVTASIGVATDVAGTSDPGTLLNRADDAMYQAKQAGRNQVVLAQP